MGRPSLPELALGSPHLKRENLNGVEFTILTIYPERERKLSRFRFVETNPEPVEGRILLYTADTLNAMPESSMDASHSINRRQRCRPFSFRIRN